MKRSQVKCIHFHGTEVEKPFNSYHIYKGNIFDQIDNALDFVFDRLKRAEIPEQGKATTKRPFEIPEFVIREAIVNAIMHRDYFDKSSDIMVEAYRNKIVIFNPGGLVKWLKPEEFGTISKRRNPIIASLLSRTIFVEKMGTGINRIRKAMETSNLPVPEFKFYEHSFYTSLFDKTMIKGIGIESQETVEKTTRKILNISRTELLTLLENKVGSKLVERVGSKLVENQLRIILLILENEKVSKNKMSEILNISTTAIDKNILKLKNLGIIKRVGPDKGGHWEILEK